MIEVFKTNVQLQNEALLIVNELARKWNNVLINFDLEDCDKILRLEGTDKIKNNYVIKYLIQLGYDCEILQ